MKYLLLLLLCCFVGLLPAQISLTQADMPEPGDTLRYSNANPTGVDFNQTGANQFWDYSNLVAVSQGREDYVYSLQTIYAFYFLGVNQYGTKIADSLGGGPFQFTEVYNFFRSATSDFRAEGVGFRYSGVPLAAYFSDEDELFQFPMEYGDRDTSTYKFTVDLGNGTSFSQEGTRINYVDGWGSIQTPWDSLDCIRLVSTTDGIDSVHFNGFNIGFPRVSRNIKFMANGVKIPVLEIIGNLQNGQFQVRQVKYRDEYQNLVAIDSPSESLIQVYPNPAKDLVNIVALDQQAVAYELLDLQGRLIQKNTATTAWHQVSLEGLSKGIYLLKVNDQEGQEIRTERIVVGE